LVWHPRYLNQTEIGIKGDGFEGSEQCFWVLVGIRERHELDDTEFEILSCHGFVLSFP
jgi:hypothetical protein